MIEVENLVKRYGGHLAVDHLSFTVEKGCVCGFLGPNGAGKSTTMNMMTGYLAPTEGEVRVDGHSVTQDPAGAKACIGYLPEQPPLYVDMTVREYLEFAAGLKRIPGGERAAQLDRILEMTRTADVSGRLIRNLSKGYRQRVGLAQALIGFPHILILDEPTVGLDPKQILEIRALIRELAQEHTVILSSHILSEVQEVCDHIFIIHHGRLVAQGTPAQLERELIEECGRLAVPGRPILYRTTKNFLRSFGLSSLEELPELPDASQESGQLTLELEAAVARLRAEESGQTVQEDGAAHPAQEETE